MAMEDTGTTCGEHLSRVPMLESGAWDAMRNVLVAQVDVQAKALQASNPDRMDDSFFCDLNQNLAAGTDLVFVLLDGETVLGEIKAMRNGDNVRFEVVDKSRMSDSQKNPDVSVYSGALNHGLLGANCSFTKNAGILKICPTDGHQLKVESHTLQSLCPANETAQA